MIDTHAAPAERPANLMSLQRELAELAARTKQADRPAQDRSQELRGPVLVIRGNLALARLYLGARRTFPPWASRWSFPALTFCSLSKITESAS